MAEENKLKVGDPCPDCGGEMRLDERQDAERLAEARLRNAANPANAQRYVEKLRAKVDEFGVMYACTRCPYRARLKDENDEGEADQGGAEPAAAGAPRRRAKK